ncbi:lytic transglycosylase domain-containing protein [Azospirillum sp. TSA6c]|uniref:lytic transglycosylase domain-containing protein n=1 Tax=unclassified Azospirillum TaxID=2630922 RepID=UPI000D64D99F|nr:lytic transglycosylase domain-containing protein [Azospirillum sp. TSA6c]
MTPGMLVRAAAAFALLGLLAFPATARAQHPCESYFAANEAAYGIPTGILHAIGMTESGRGGATWPWALNLGGAPAFPASRGEALALMGDGAGSLRLDMAVGCMQVHTRWHARAFRFGEDILDPATNVAYAAAFLRLLYDRHGTWTEAVRRYHAGAGNTQAQDIYLCRVLGWRVRLGYQRETSAMDGLCAAARTVSAEGR